MKKTFIFVFMLTACLALVGCGFSKDAEVTAFTNDLDKITSEIAAKINASPNEAGVDEAQKVFDVSKADLQTKWNGIKDAREIQVSGETVKKMEDRMNKNVETLTGLGDKLEDPEAAQKYGQMLMEFGKMFTQK